MSENAVKTFEQKRKERINDELTALKVQIRNLARSIDELELVVNAEPPEAVQENRPRTFGSRRES